MSSWRWDASNERDYLPRAVVVVALTIIFTVLWSSRFVKKRKQAGPPLPPGPRGLPVLGHLPFLGVTDLHKRFTELGKVYGPIYKLWLGSKLYVVVGSPSLAREVVRDRDVIFANRDPSIATFTVTYGANDIVWSSYGPQWKKLRKTFVREMLSKASRDASSELRKEEVRRCIRDVYRRSGSPVEITGLAFTTSANTVIRMLCGDSIRSEKWADFVAEFRDLAEEMMVLLGKPNVSDLIPVLASFDFQGIEKQAKRLSQGVERILDCMVKQRLNFTKKEEVEEAEEKDFLQILLDFHKHEDAETSITMNQLKGTLVDILLGGTDTTATAIEWTMTELMKRKEVMEKIQKELEQVVGKNNIVEEFHLPKLQYLDAVVKEVLRLHPPVPMLLPHSSSQSCTVGGYNIPKGTTVFLNVYAMHRDPHLWSNPLEFKPERFQDSNYDYAGNNFQYLPFGSGRRMCAGVPLAEKMVMHVLASLLHSFDWKLPNGTDLEFSEKFGIVVKKSIPLILIPTPRLSYYELY